MKRLKIWVLLLLFALNPRAEAATALKFRRNSTLIDSSRGLSPQASIGVPRRLPSPWAVTGYRGRPRSTTEATTTLLLLEEETETPSPNATSAEDDAFRRRSDEGGALVWPHRARASRMRLRVPTPTTPVPQLLLKLLQPRPTRPAIYSLDGFVPKPSIQTTEPPLYKKTDLQLLASAPRRRKAQRYSKVVSEEEDEDFYEGRTKKRKRKRPVSRYTAFARKGVPGEDFPVYTFIPLTEFDCGLQPGLYADPYTDCQVWHMCPGGNLSPRHSFLCPNGTIFNQKKRICDWWYNVDCRKHTRKIRSFDTAE